MSEAISPFQKLSVRASFALNVALALAILLPMLPIVTNAADTRFCALTSPAVASSGLAQSTKIRPNTGSSVMKLPVSNMHRSALPKSAHLADTQISFVRCVPRDARLAG